MFCNKRQDDVIILFMFTQHFIAIFDEDNAHFVELVKFDYWLHQALTETILCRLTISDLRNYGCCRWKWSCLSRTCHSTFFGLLIQCFMERKSKLCWINPSYEGSVEGGICCRRARYHSTTLLGQAFHLSWYVTGRVSTTRLYTAYVVKCSCKAPRWSNVGSVS